MKTFSIFLYCIILNIISTDLVFPQIAPYNYLNFSLNSFPVYSQRWQDEVEKPNSRQGMLLPQKEAYRNKIKTNKIKNIKVSQIKSKSDNSPFYNYTIAKYDKNGYLIDSSSAQMSKKKSIQGRIEDSYLKNGSPVKNVVDDPINFFSLRFEKGELVEAWLKSHAAGPAFGLFSFKNVYEGDRIVKFYSTQINYYDAALMDGAKPGKYSCEGGELLKSVFKYDYNQNGSLKSITLVSGNPQDSGSYKCTYNSRGDLIEEIFPCSNESRKAEYIKTYQYDDNHNLTSFRFYSNSKEKFMERCYKYDKSGLMIEESLNIFTNNKPEQENISKYMYNDRNQLIEITYQYPSQNAYRIDKYEYDKSGNLISVTIFNDEQKQTGKTIYKYNSSRELDLETYFSADNVKGSEYKYEYEYYK